MLHDFLAANRSELIRRCKEKVARRFAPSPIPAEVGDGVPLFLDQLVDTLRREQNTLVRDGAETSPTPAPTEIGRAAALHGAKMLRGGYSVDQVVHEYGDVCQSVTDLAVEQEARVSVDEFRTLNRCLDNAIADAVTAFADGGQVSIDERADALSDQLDAFGKAQGRLLDLAIQSFAAMQTGSIGPSGATGMAHKNSLHALRALVDQFIARIRLASALTTLRPDQKPSNQRPK